MNIGSPQQSASSSLSSTSGPPGSHRKERGAIAAQACDTCRSRKQKCDENRPKCGHCQKFGTECRYREPQPTKKDKTLVEILDRLKGLEDKFDSFAQRGALPQQTIYAQPGAAAIVSNPSTILGSEALSSLPLDPLHHADSANTVDGNSEYRYVSSVHQMLGWPMTVQLLEPLLPKIPRFDIATIAHEGIGMMLGLDGTGISSESMVSSAGEIAAATSELDWESMQSLCNAFFDTFNCIFPIVDRHAFLDNVLPSAVKSRFSEPSSAALTYLVLALGEVAISGVQGSPVTVHNGRPSGVKGGSQTQPPGVTLFNAGRSMMGFTLAECSIESIQIYALAGLYCGTCSHHFEFYRLTTTASFACQALITTNRSVLESPSADLIRRLFWYCLLTETFFNLELDLPTTGLEKLEKVVSVPDFSGAYSEQDYMANQTSHFQEHFVSQIFLRRLSLEFHSILSSGQSLPNQYAPISPAGVVPTSGLPSFPNTVRQLVSQLDQWRAMLPPSLRWDESAQQPEGHMGLMFSSDLDGPALAYPYATDIQVALLRTRYSHARWVLHRPFLYKALHHPDSTTHNDALGAAECLRSCLRWPVFMMPAAARKRLVPVLSFWTQNVLGVLVVLHLSTQTALLRNIRRNMCGERFDLEAQETVDLYLEWLRDLSTVDRGAAWAWEVVRCLYGTK